MIKRIKHALWKMYTGRTLSLHEWMMLEAERRKIRESGSTFRNDSKYER